MNDLTLHIIDNGLQSKVGHHFNYTRTIVGAAKRRGMNVTVWGHSSLVDADILEFAKPHFRHNIYTAFFENGLDYSTYLQGDIDPAVAMHLADTKAIFETINQDDPVFIPNILNVEISALLLLLRGNDFENPLSIVVRYKPNFDDSPASVFFLEALREVCQLHKRTAVFADTANLVEFLIGKGIPAGLMITPLEIPYGDLILEDRFDFAYVGQATEYKGFFQVANALIIGKQIGFCPRVAMQATLLDPGMLATLKTHLPDVVWISEGLDTKSYYQLMASADTIIVFYDPKVYSTGSSGILVEALALNRRVLTSTFSHAAELLGKDLSMFSAAEYTHTALLRKMIEFQGFSSVPRSFLKCTDSIRNMVNPNLLLDMLLLQ